MTKRGRPKSGKERKAVGLSVNPEAWEKLQVRAEALGMTRSDLVEALALGNIPLEDLSRQKLLGKPSAS